MASFAYTVAKKKIIDGDIHFDTDDIRVALVMTNTTADTEKDVATFAAMSTLDEMDGANYVRKELADEATAQDDANDRAEFDADDVVFSALGNGTRQIAGAIVYFYAGAGDANAIPIAYIDDAPLPLDPGGADFTLQWSAEGIVQIT